MSNGQRTGNWAKWSAHLRRGRREAQQDRQDLLEGPVEHDGARHRVLGRRLLERSLTARDSVAIAPLLRVLTLRNSEFHQLCHDRARRQQCYNSKR